MTSLQTQRLIYRAAQRLSGTTVLRGPALFEGTSYPRTWDNYVGQTKAVRLVKIAAASARARNERLDHMLIAAGGHGIGKTAIVRLIAKEMNAGLVEVQGAIDEAQAIRILKTMEDGDVLFWDECHQAISGGKTKAEWLLSYLQDGVIIGAAGTTVLPNVTIIGATTDVQKLPETITSRFPLRPPMDEYSNTEAMEIARRTAAGTLGKHQLATPSDAALERIAVMSNSNPRAIGQVLRNLRDLLLAQVIPHDPNGNYDLDEVCDFMDLTPDGLDDLAKRYLLSLATSFEGKPAGEKAIAAVLGETTTPRHTEKLLLNKGFIALTPQGRTLTLAGQERVEALTEAV